MNLIEKRCQHLYSTCEKLYKLCCTVDVDDAIMIMYVSCDDQVHSLENTFYFTRIVVYLVRMYLMRSVNSTHKNYRL